MRGMARRARFDRGRTADDALARLREEMSRREERVGAAGDGASASGEAPEAGDGRAVGRPHAMGDAPATDRFPDRDDAHAALAAAPTAADQGAVRSTCLYADIPLPVRGGAVREQADVPTTPCAAGSPSRTPASPPRSADARPRAAAGRAPRAGAPVSIWDSVYVSPAAAEPAPEPLPQAFARFEQVRSSPGFQSAGIQEQFLALARALADVRDEVPGFDEREMPAMPGYLPGYASMSDRQLRWYVTWRTRLRDGKEPALPGRSSYGYLVLLCTELLDEAGVEPGDAVVDAILGLRRRYARTDPRASSSLRAWAGQYAVTHGLDLEKLPADVRPWEPAERAMGTLLSAERAFLDGDVGDGAPDAREIKDAVLGALNMPGHVARMVPQGVPDQDFCAAMAGVLLSMVRRSARQGKRRFVEGMLLSPTVQQARPFSGTLATVPRPGRVQVSPFPGLTWSYEPGRGWRVERLRLGGNGVRRLADMARAVRDALLAEYGLPPAAPKGPAPLKYLQAAAEREAARIGDWRRAHTVPQLQIDRSALGGIRQAAARTRDSLLVDEEREGYVPDEAVPSPQVGTTGSADSTGAQPPAPPAPIAPAPAAGTGAAALGLDAAQEALLRALLRGGPVAEAVAAAGESTDLAVDALNERLFDFLGDTAVEFVDGMPAVVPDYSDDLRQALGD